jgi:hypothetical protein
MISMDDIVRAFGHEMDAVADTLLAQSTHLH